ncbi:MAG: hypothetical protein ACHQXA_06735 [Gemmatimonadales bacterium]
MTRQRWRWLRSLLLVALYAAGSFGLPDLDALVFHHGKFQRHPTESITSRDGNTSHDQSCLLGYSPPATPPAPSAPAACWHREPARRAPAARAPSVPVSFAAATPKQPRAPPTSPA